MLRLPLVGDDISCAVTRWRLIGLSARDIGVLPHAGSVRGDEGADLVADPRVLPDDVPALLRIGCEIEGAWERPIFDHAVHALEPVQVNLVVAPFDGHEPLAEEQQDVLAVVRAFLSSLTAFEWALLGERPEAANLESATDLAALSYNVVRSPHAHEPNAEMIVAAITAVIPCAISSAIPGSRCCF